MDKCVKRHENVATLPVDLSPIVETGGPVWTYFQGFVQDADGFSQLATLASLNGGFLKSLARPESVKNI